MSRRSPRLLCPLLQLGYDDIGEGLVPCLTISEAFALMQTCRSMFISVFRAIIDARLVGRSSAADVRAGTDGAARGWICGCRGRYADRACSFWRAATTAEGEGEARGSAARGALWSRRGADLSCVCWCGCGCAAVRGGYGRLRNRSGRGWSSCVKQVGFEAVESLKRSIGGLLLGEGAWLTV